MRVFKITLAYDGTDLVGWQRQVSGTSVQGLLEDALRVLDGRAVDVIGAGRTDGGAHALGQVASFSLARSMPPERLAAALNARLPHAVRVVSVEPAPERFHARFRARSKIYRYRIWHADVINPFESRYAWHLSGPLDVAAMAEAARVLEGRHDFEAFLAAGSSVASTEREVFSSRLEIVENAMPLGYQNVKPSGLPDEPAAGGSRLVLYHIHGSGFLRHMVRTIVGSLVEIGRGRRPPAWMYDVLVSRDRTRAGPTAPPRGLFLVRVSYEAPPRDPVPPGLPCS